MLFQIVFFLLFLLLNFASFVQASSELVELEPPFQSTFPHLPAINFNKVHQDSDGIIWLASDQGLYRFDGQKVKVLNSENSELSNNVVVDIVGYGNQGLWLSTYGGGLVRFDLTTDTFTTFRQSETDDSLSSDTLWDIEPNYSDPQYLWIGSRRWLNRFDTKTVSNQRLNPDLMSTFKVNNNIWNLYQDSQQYLWIGTLGGGLYQFDIASETVTQYNKHSGLSHNLVRSVIEDDHNQLWVGTDYGLNVFNKKTRQFKQYFHQADDSFSLSSNEINKLYKDNRGDIWIGTYGAGLNRYDRQKQRFIRYDFASLGLNQTRTPKIINDILQDNHGIIWVATDKGVIKLLPSVFAGKHYGLAQLKDNSTSLVFPQGDRYWATINNQLVNFDSETHRINQAITLPDKVLAAATYGDDTLWLSVIRQGVYKLEHDIENSRYELTPVNIGKNVSYIYAESQQRIWLGRFRDDKQGGLQLYQPGKGVTQTWFASDSILDIERLDADTLLLATNNRGVILFNLRNYEYQRIVSNDDTLNHIIDLHIGNDKRIWLGTTSGGLAELLLASQTLKPLAPSLGAVDWVVQTTNDRLWLAANNHLVEFDIANQSTRIYDHAAGLAINKFNKKSAVVIDDKIFFGTDTGLFKLDLAAKWQEIKPNPVSFTEFKLFNRPVKLEKSINHSHELTLSYDDYLFSIGFSAPDFQYGDKQIFQYQLTGFDDRWISTDNSNSIATYSSVPPGDYQFKVKVLQHNNMISPVRSIAITINPPWWLTSFAYIGYVCIVVLLVALLIHIRTRGLTKRAFELERGIASRTTELAQKNATIEVLLQQKQRLFTNISHELRTPLTLLLGPAEMLIRQLADSPHLSTIQLIRRNALRMQHMVEQLLQLASIEAGRQQSYKVITIRSALSQLVEAAQSLTKWKQQRLILQTIPNVFLKMQQDAFEQVFGNLLSNAIKYAGENAQIEVSAQLDAEFVVITIKDNGCGIAKQYQPYIFERFERGAFANDSVVSGSGIGLALVKELVEVHQGQVSLESEKGAGCIFMVRLPTYHPQSPSNSDEPLDLNAWVVGSQQEIEDGLSGQSNSPLSCEWLDEDERPLLLIVEDNNDMRSHLLSILQNDYRCVSAVNGQQGLEIARELVPSVVVCDVMMPLMNGFEFCAELKQDEVLCHIPVVLLTALADQQNREEGWQNQADEYLSKPFSLQELKLRLENLLAIRAILRERYASEYRNDPQALVATKSELNKKDQQFIEQFEQLIELNFADAEFQLTQAADELFMSERQLQRKLKAIMDMNFSQILRRYRLQQAAERLCQGQAVNLVADSVGFSSAAYFSTCFKAEFGDTPKSYQQQVIAANRSEVKRI